MPIHYRFSTTMTAKWPKQHCGCVSRHCSALGGIARPQPVILLHLLDVLSCSLLLMLCACERARVFHMNRRERQTSHRSIQIHQKAATTFITCCIQCLVELLQFKWATVPPTGGNKNKNTIYKHNFHKGKKKKTHVSGLSLSAQRLTLPSFTSHTRNHTQFLYILIELLPFSEQNVWKS